MLKTLGAAVVVLLAVAVAVPARAQYFGQNKVQYERFDFRVLQTTNFDIYFYPEEQAGLDAAARSAERWNTRLVELFTHRLSDRQPLVMYASPTHFQQTNVIPGALGEGTGGVTEGVRRRIVLPFAGPLEATDHVIGHELVHAFQYDIAAGARSGQPGGGERGMQSLPLWFIEGMAEYLSIGRRSPLTAMWMRDAVAREDLPRIKDLNNPKLFPYRWGHAFWAYVAGRWGDATVARMLEHGMESGDPKDTITAVLGTDEETLSAEWHAALQKAYGGAGAGAPPLERYGTLLTPGDEPGKDLNVSPSLSRDGHRVAFLSSRGLFSIDLYIVDADTGRILKRLTSTDVDPHVSSLQFIESGGTWDPTGRQLAATVIVSGRPVLALFDVDSGRRVREIALDGVQGAINPTWSPDGRRIAFMGVVGGLTDLFICDLENGALTRLTDNAFSELQPAWSPDGRALAFATDRFSTNLDTLSFGELSLAVIDVASRSIERVGGFERGDHRNPQWSADGRSLFFIGLPDGVPNVYRVDRDGTNLRRITRVRTGVAGITENSPALSVAGDRIAFTVFDKGGYRLYATGDRAVVAGTDDAQPGARYFGDLPPEVETPGSLTTLLMAPSRGLPTPNAWPEPQPYAPRLGLEYVAQPSVTVGYGSYGAIGGGGVGFVLGDMLGDHQLAFAVQSMSTFDGEFSVNDIGGAVMYRNLSRRWNWGVGVDQSPYRTGGISQALADIDGTPSLVEQTVIFRQTDRGVSGVAAYALSRAQRVELSAGFRNISIDWRTHTRAFDLSSGDLIFDERETTSPYDPLNLGLASAALVYDTTTFGATSPVLGQRYRFEVSPTIGSLRYTSLLADYRRYFMPASLYTFAGRVMHYGRYGSDSDDPRLSPLFLGYPTLVRGYDVGSFDASECVIDANGRCASLDNLIGTRLLVANLEFRFPLLRPFGLREGVYGPVPIEAAFFADAGVAWDRGEKPSFFDGDRKGVSSVGVALRVNALGFAILQFDYAKPLQRPDKGWVFQFSMAPGF